MNSQDYNNYTYIKTCSAVGYATQVSTDPCVLKAIIMNVVTKWAVGVVDGTSGSTANVATIATNYAAGAYLYNCQMTNGLRIITVGASTIKPNCTVVWRR